MRRFGNLVAAVGLAATMASCGSPTGPDPKEDPELTCSVSNTISNIDASIGGEPIKFSGNASATSNGNAHVDSLVAHYKLNNGAEVRIGPLNTGSYQGTVPAQEPGTKVSVGTTAYASASGFNQNINCTPRSAAQNAIVGDRPNNAPQINSIQSLDNVIIGSPARFVVDWNDADGDALSARNWSPSPTQMRGDTAWINFPEAKTYAVEATVTDTKGAQSNTASLNVTPSQPSMTIEGNARKFFPDLSQANTDLQLYVKNITLGTDTILKADSNGRISATIPRGDLELFPIDATDFHWHRFAVEGLQGYRFSDARLQPIAVPASNALKFDIHTLDSSFAGAEMAMYHEGFIPRKDGYVVTPNVRQPLTFVLAKGNFTQPFEASYAHADQVQNFTTFTNQVKTLANHSLVGGSPAQINVVVTDSAGVEEYVSGVNGSGWPIPKTNVELAFSRLNTEEAANWTGSGDAISSYYGLTAFDGSRVSSFWSEFGLDGQVKESTSASDGCSINNNYLNDKCDNQNRDGKFTPMYLSDERMRQVHWGFGLHYRLGTDKAPKAPSSVGTPVNKPSSAADTYLF